MYPTKISLNRDRTSLSVTWESGVTTVYPAARLREQARDAGSVRFVVDGKATSPAPDLTITGVDPVGNYGVRLAFSDGHDRGIFPWTYLIEIGEADLPTSVAGR
jgi:DUF971 family protein